MMIQQRQRDSQRDSRALHSSRRHRGLFWPALGAWFLAGALLLAGTEAASAATQMRTATPSAEVNGGAALLKAGNYQAVVSQETAALNTPLSQRDAATALYFRGLAYRKLGRTSDSLVDLGAAIYLGLPTTQRIVAQIQRAYVFQGLGLQEQSQKEIALAKMAAPHETAELLRQGDVIGNMALATPDSAGHYGSWWDRVTGGFGSFRSRPSPAPAPTATAKATPPSSGGRGTSGWSITVDQTDEAVAEERASSRKKSSSAPAAAAATPAPLPTEAAAETTPQTSSSGGAFSRWIGAWTGSSSSKQAPAAAAQPATGAWSTETHSQ
jgi:tetratricopeptide (TPR) repeat protein